MISLEQARSVVLSCVDTLEPTTIALDDAVGLTLARDVHASESVPRFANSAMDGYALRAVDATSAPARLKVVATTLAGDRPAAALGDGEAVRIMTGAPIPEGADAVCMVEDTTSLEEGALVELARPAAQGAHIRLPGSDIEAGQLLFARGTVISPRHIGVLASVGVDTVTVRPRVRVGVMATGNELRGPLDELEPGQIRESNRHMLLALVADAGAIPLDLGIVDDEDDHVVAALEQASASCDLVLTSGGVSVGDKDVIRSVLERVCPARGKVLRVAIKPAKPLVCGVLASGATLIGLPGNPVSSLVSFECFVRPALAQCSGSPEPIPHLLAARALGDFTRQPDGRMHLVGASAGVDADGVLAVERIAGPGSHMLWSVAEATVLVHLPDGMGVPAGSIVAVQPIGSLRCLGPLAPTTQRPS